jgi:hypothetical protein
MTLHIAKLTTRCHTPRRQEGAGALVDEVARHSLPRDLRERLGPALDRQPAVVRVRRLDVNVRIDVVELKRGGLAAAWVNAIARALLEAFVRPDGDGEMVRRFESRTAYVAAMVVHALQGSPEARCWQFPELASRAGRHPAIVVLDLLQSGSLLGDVLEALRRAGKLVAVLALLDEVGLERLVRVAAEDEGGDGALTTAQLVALASALLAMRTPPVAGESASRRGAIELWLQFCREMPVRGIWHGSRLLLRFLEEPGLLAPGTGAGRGATAVEAVVLPPSLAALMSHFPAWCEEVRRQLACGPPERFALTLERLRRITPSAAPSAGGTRGPPEPFALVLERLRRITPSAAASAGGTRGPPDPFALVPERLRPITPSAAASAGGTELRWLRLDDAGLLLLYPVIRHLGWVRVLRDRGPRIFQAMVAGAGMRLLSPWQPGDKVEPAPGILAGLFGEPERLGIGQTFGSTSAAALCSQANDWPTALDAAADALASGLALRVRGFRTAGRESIVRHFLRVSGRVLFGEKELCVVLEPSPWSVALHISGADDPVEEIEWLGRRRVTYMLEGL